nr:uncharacterized protein LOC133611023 [Nerophis lumbriciformis]
MRDNLIFSGIREGNADPEKTVREFMSDKLKLFPEVVEVSEVERLLHSLPYNKVAGIDNLDKGSPPRGQKQKKHKLLIGAWNVRTLMDNQASDRPERRTAIISRELRKFQIDIAALSETRLADEGQLKEEKGGYTFFWKGKPANEPRIHGVGFAIKNCLINHLHELPVGINERLMTLRLMLASSHMATVVSAYAPTLDAQDEVKEAFYADLDKVLSEVPKEDKLILLGDFNARVERNHYLWRGTLGREGVGNTNSNGALLLTKCSEHNLVITNTLFRQKTKFKTSWMHPRSKLWHLIDYVIVRSKDRHDVLNTRAMTSADDCWTDHRLIRTIMSIRLMRKRRMQKRHEKSSPRQSKGSPLRSKDGLLLLKDKDAISNRWKEHYEDLLNRDTIPEMEALDQLPQQPTDESMGEPPTLDELQDAIGKMRNNKAAGPDGIPAEVLKKGGPDLTKHIHALLLKIWEEEEISAQLRDALIVSIFKKGDKADCGNYRGISLLSTIGKALARVLANRLTLLSESVLPESQSGFRPSRGTTDMIFIARQLQEKCREQNQSLYMAFIDLTKAFDSVNRQALWLVLSKIGCPDKYIRVLRLLHDNMSATVLSGSGDETEPFRVDTGVKQGCVIAPTLFSIFVATILHLTNIHLPQGVEIMYRTDGQLLNINRFRAKGQTTTISIMELQYADDNALIALSEEDLQCTLSAFAKAYKQLGLAINIKKTQILHQSPPNSSAPVLPPNLSIDKIRLENVDHFPYLGSLLSSKAVIDDEIHHLLSCASGAFSRLRKRVFENRDLQAKTKILVYKAVVLPTLLYGSEAWTTYSRHLKALETYHHRCLRKILRISWEDRRTNTSVLEEAGLPPITATIAQNQLRWTGHVVRMPDSRLPKQVLYSQLVEGKRAPGGQKKRFKDNIKANLTKCRIDRKSWEVKAKDRTMWRNLVCEGAAQYNDDLRHAAQDKRRLRKERASTKQAQPKPTTTTFPCPHCPRIIGSRIGLHAHLKTHKDQEGGQSYSTTSDRR